MVDDVKAAARTPSKTPKAKVRELPVVLVANDLLDGDVVFLGESGWTRDPAEARVAGDEASAASLEAEAAADFKANRIVDPYLVAVVVNAHGLPVARHFREAIRQRGPSIHPEYGKEAEFHNRYEG